MKLALTNDGTAADDEIDITLKIPRIKYLSLEELPVLEEETMQYLTQDCSLWDLLSIHGTAEYSDYDSSIKNPLQSTTPSSTPSIFNRTDYTEKYREELEDVFCYEVFEDGVDCVIKLKVDHLKHHKTVAFPAALLLKEKPEVINYTITSKNTAEVISGQISVE